jgi:hypothetical protein
MPYTHQAEAPRSAFHLTDTVSTGVPIQDLASISHQVMARSIDQGRAEVLCARRQIWC